MRETPGSDSKLVMFRVSPGELIHVRTPQQQAQRPLTLPRWLVVVTFVMLIVGLVYAAVTS